VTDTRPPEEDLAGEAPPAPTSVSERPTKASKPKLSPAFVILGLAVALAVYGAIVVVGNYVNGLVPAIPVIIGIHFIASLVLFIAGLTTGRARMRSFGLGGLLAYAIGALGLLLIFGSCLVGGWN
jgi:heme A synthase